MRTIKYTDRLLGIDPGYATCGWVILEGGVPIHFGAYNMTGKSFPKCVISRSILICRALQGLVKHYNIKLYASEEFFGRYQSVIYDRGRFDGILHLSLAHIRGYQFKPTIVKKWATSRGNSTKEMMAEAIEDKTKAQYPDFYDKVREVNTVEDRLHVLDAFTIAHMAWCMELYRKGENPDGILPSQLELLKKVEGQQILRPQLTDTASELSYLV